MHCCFSTSQEKSYQEALAQANADFASKLAVTANEDKALHLIEDHEHRIKILLARQEREKEEQMTSLKKKLAERRRTKMTALHIAQEEQVRLANISFRTLL